MPQGLFWGGLRDVEVSGGFWGSEGFWGHLEWVGGGSGGIWRGVLASMGGIWEGLTGLGEPGGVWEGQLGAVSKGCCRPGSGEGCQGIWGNPEDKGTFGNDSGLFEGDPEDIWGGPGDQEGI